MDESQPKLESDWLYRRSCVFATLLFCAVVISYCTFYAASDPLREQIVLAAFGLAGMILCGYLGIAAWDDKNWIKARIEAQQAK
jgi:bacteriorhodopsin